MSYVDADAANPVLRPFVALVPGFVSLGDAYLAYDQSSNPGAGLAGFGSFSVAVVPEPAALLLMLAGLAFIGATGRMGQSGRQVRVKAAR